MYRPETPSILLLLASLTGVAVGTAIRVTEARICRVVDLLTPED